MSMSLQWLILIAAIFTCGDVRRRQAACNMQRDVVMTVNTGCAMAEMELRRGSLFRGCSVHSVVGVLPNDCHGLAIASEAL